MSPNNLLIVDDSPYLHKIIRAHLRPDPIFVHSAYDGEAGLVKAAGLQPHLVLMDIDMPGLDGMEVCRRLKDNPLTSDTPVIFLSADCSTHDKVKAFEMGAVDFITKPFQLDEVRARVRAALSAKSIAQQMVMIDSLTGLWNQAYLDVLLPAQIALAERIGEPLSCVIAEIDEMEKLYEEHGRPAAEQIIKSIAETFVVMSRSEDVVCHLGSGRVVILQSATSQKQAMTLAEQMHTEIQRQLLYFEFMGARITCSFGVAQDHWTGSLLEDAGEALLQGKESGGNVVIGSSQPGNQSLHA
jgi:diguanylate cyclase (GGDEF)-like protein